MIIIDPCFEMLKSPLRNDDTKIPKCKIDLKLDQLIPQFNFAIKF